MNFRRKSQYIGFVLILLTFFSGLIAIKNVSAAVGHPPIIEHPQLSTPNEFLVSTPTPEFPVVPDDDVEKFLPAASQFTDPQKRPNIDDQYNAQSFLDNPSNYDGYQVELQGKILKIQRFEGSIAENWNDDFVITIDDGSALISVLYRGSLYKLENGSKVNVSGMFVAEGAVIHADVLYPVIQGTPWIKTLPQGLLPFGIAVIVLGITALLLLVFTKKTVSVLILLLVLLSLSACEIHIENLIKPNGSITTSIQIMEAAENVDFIRKIPGLDRYISSWIAGSRNDGSLIENWVEGEDEYFYIQQNYVDIDSLIQNDGSEEETESQTWVYVKSFSVGNESCYRYLAQVTPDLLYKVPEDTDSRVEKEIHKLVDDIDMTYGVTLPGRVLYSNSQNRFSNYLEWEIALRKNNELIAESCSYQPPVLQLDWIWVWLALGGLGLVDIGLWVLVVRKIIDKKEIKNKHLDGG